MPRDGAGSGSPQAAGAAGAESLLGGQQVVVYDAEEAAIEEARKQEEVEREQAEFKMMQAVVGTVFSTKMPRDVVAGTSSGLKTVARSVGLGLASLVAQPYIGAKHGGVKGFAKGLGGGVATCVASTVAGAAVGTTQVIRGVFHTPEAIAKKARGQIWNPELRRWEVDWYSLPEEEAELFGDAGAEGNGGSAASGSSQVPGSASAAPPRRPARHVVDKSLYQLLEVPPEATEAEIRKAFYKKSLALHPDKNPDNPEATKQFQAVSEAYRILGDEDRRRAYDDHGQDSATVGMPKIEPVVFFAALFGSHHFEPLIGRLRLAQDIDGDLQSLLRDAVAGTEEDAPAIDILKVQRAHERMKLLERERQVRCAIKLVKRLEPVVGLTEEVREQAFARWETEQRAEVAKLSQVPCGVEMLSVIGWVYANRARQFFAGGVVRRVLAKVEGEVHFAHSKAKLAQSVGRTCFTVNGIMKTAEKKNKSLKAKSNSEECGSGDDEAGAPKRVSSKEGSKRASSKEAPSKASGADGGNTPTASPTADTAGTPSSAAAKDSKKQSSGGTNGGTNGSTNGFGHHSNQSGGAVGSTATASGVSKEDTDAKATIMPGTLVMIRGLRSSPELNNEVGMVVEYDEKARRFVVQILPDGGVKKLKFENLVVLEVPFPDGNTASSNGHGGAEGQAGGTESGFPGEDQWAPGGEDAEMADAFKDCMPLFHDAFWGVTALDVEFTLGKVIQKVLRDMSVDRVVRRQRAEAILRLGNVFQEPMRELKAKVKAESGSMKQGLLDEAVDQMSFSHKPSVASAASTSSKRSVLARFKPRAPWRSNSQRTTQKAKAMEAKQKRLEAAVAMMAAGASTEDVDEMIAARAAMEAEEAMGGTPTGFP